MIVRDAQIENAHYVPMIDARDNLILLKKSIKERAASGVRHMPQHLESNAFAR